MAFQIMGIINVTPDSFSDGGKFLRVEDAVKQASSLLCQGADILDIGGESTRPGAVTVSADQEMDRVLPVIEKLSQTTGASLSIDTRKFEVAEAAVKVGATIVNDQSGGADIRLASLAVKQGLKVILMHHRGDPKTMQSRTDYPEGVVSEVVSFLRNRIKAFKEVGLTEGQLWVDPGIGFGKTVEQNLALIQQTAQLVPLAGGVVMGSSRKSFIAKFEKNPELSFEEREPGTLASNLYAYSQGARIFRVHDVAPLSRALRLWKGIEDAGV